MTDQAKTISNQKIIVTGDVTTDWLEISTPPVAAFAAESTDVPNWQTYEGTCFLNRPGGALLLARFVRDATGMKILSPKELDPVAAPSEKEVRSFALLAPKNPGEVIRVKQYKGFLGPHDGSPTFLPVQNDDPRAAVVIVDDAGNGFRSEPDAWPAALQKGNTPLVIYKMSRPLKQSLLLDQVLENHGDRAIFIVTAGDLRLEGANISRRLSWERTATDFAWQLACNRKLAFLKKCAYLVVRFGVEGAILCKFADGDFRARLFYDPGIGENGFKEQYPGKMLGLGNAFTAALSASLAPYGLEGLKDSKLLGEGVRKGILSSRLLWRLGFGEDPAGIDYPGPELFKATDDSTVIVNIAIPKTETHEQADPDYWCILHDLAQTGIEQAAFNYVMNGRDHALDRVPMGNFRYLKTLDRSEIEGFRSIKNLIGEYLDSSRTDHPLCIAVFGAPGSGKSFGVTEVAESVAPGEIQKLDFNLSQFNTTQDLIAAFHKVRDVALGGKVPIVFFDEFDSDFNGRLGWLKYFLAPMQDGEFREGDTLHPLGRAIFVFAGGTCTSFEKFAGEEDEKEETIPNQKNAGDASHQTPHEEDPFKLAKGPDFVSRLRGYVNIKAADPENGKDRLYMVRRAIILRYLLESNAKHLINKASGKLAMDEGVLRAMIKVPKYKHGVRSMCAIIEMSMLAERKRFEQAALPSQAQLDMHVDAEAFLNLAMRDVTLSSYLEKFAEAIHEKYRKDQKGKKPANDPAMVPWNELSEGLKESNRKQAYDIPTKLEAVGCDFSPVHGRKIVPMQFREAEIEHMAEMEHARWVRERLADAWKPDPRDLEKKTTPHLLPWDDLDEETREYDRDAVKGIPDVLAMAGFEIGRLKE